MATPYLQETHEEVVSTQDLARGALRDLPQVVIASSQTGGRGRTGSTWLNADRALAVSVAWATDTGDERPFSLMAGIAAARVTSPSVGLKWPNDLLIQDAKLGGILVERNEASTVVGLGLNLYWADPPDSMTALFASEPEAALFAELGAIWAAEFLAMIGDSGWPVDEYRSLCHTLGRDVTWEPNGRGLAAGISSEGALLVETEAGIQEVVAGEIQHLRS